MNDDDDVSAKLRIAITKRFPLHFDMLFLVRRGPMWLGDTIGDIISGSVDTAVSLRVCGAVDRALEGL